MTKMEKPSFTPDKLINPPEEMLSNWRDRLMSPVSEKRGQFLGSLNKLYGKKLRQGEWLKIDPPDEETQKALLFLEPPQNITLSPDNLEELKSVYLNLVPLPELSDEKGQFHQESKVFLEKVWFNINRFRRSARAPVWYSIDDLPEVKNLALTYKLSSEHMLRLRNQYAFNFQQAISALIKGYEGKYRWTGEPKWVHPVRAFLRHATAWIPRDPDYSIIAYLSNLAMLLHDCKEDFDHFLIEKAGPEMKNYYYISFQKDGKTHKFPLALYEGEAELLKMEVDTLSVPPEAEALYKDDPLELAHTQFKHLETGINRILAGFPKDTGIYAALYTLWGKVEDRRDNNYAYWTLGNTNGNHKEKLLNKIWETIHYFEWIEELVEDFFMKLPVFPKKEDIRQRYLRNLDSTVNFAYLMLLGGTYNSLFEKSIKYFKEVQQLAKSDKSKSSEHYFNLNYHLFNPSAYFKDFASLDLA